MEKNTVLLDLNEYNSLRDLRKALFEGKTVGVYVGMALKDNVPQLFFYTDNEVVKEMENKNKDLMDVILDYKRQSDVRIKEITRLRHTILNIKGMSVREFKKWRKAILSF